jgi:hypothetical protein
MIIKKQEFDLEWQYQQYLKRIKLVESEMGEEQRKQLRQTFFGSWGQALLTLRDDVGRLEENDAVDTMQDMINQVANYFLQFKGQQN